MLNDVTPFMSPTSKLWNSNKSDIITKLRSLVILISDWLINLIILWKHSFYETFLELIH